MTRSTTARVARSVDAVEPAPSVVTIGVFDGVHRGHQHLIGRAVTAARDAAVRAAVITFDRNPLEVLRPDQAPPALQTLDARIEAIVDQGVDLVLVLPFTPALAALSPEAFVTEVLAGPLHAVRVVVGENFRFGHRAAGDTTALADLGRVHGFEVDVVALVGDAEAAISSSAVRSHLAAGDVRWVAGALGRPFVLEGRVERGDGRGRTIGVPTANVVVEPGLAVPAGGVYAGFAWAVEDDGPRGDDPLEVAPRHPCVVNVGSRPTFGGGALTVEAHLLDADVDLYDRRLAIAFEHRLRDERRFDGPDDLVAQIRRDIDEARTRL